MPDLNVSVVITNYNGKNLLEENLPAVVSARENPSNKIIEILVVDDASTDKSVSFLKSDFPGVRVISHRQNRGFAAATNTGVRMAKGKLVCLLNNDVSPSPNFLESVFQIFEKETGTFGISLHEKGYGPAAGFFEGGFVIHRPLPELKKVNKTFWVSGGSGIFSRDLWVKVGWLDEELFKPFYWEDVDLSYRALKRGYKLFWAPEARVLHQHEATMSKFSLSYRQRIQERNQLLFIWKNINSRRFLTQHFWGLALRVAKHPGYLTIVFAAFSKIRRVLKWRKKEKREGIVADEFIFSGFKK